MKELLELLLMIILISNFTQLLEKKREFTIHQQNIQALMKEIYKFTNNLSPPIINHVSILRKFL